VYFRNKGSSLCCFCCVFDLNWWGFAAGSESASHSWKRLSQWHHCGSHRCTGRPHLWGPCKTNVRASGPIQKELHDCHRSVEAKLHATTEMAQRKASRAHVAWSEDQAHRAHAPASVLGPARGCREDSGQGQCRLCVLPILVRLGLGINGSEKNQAGSGDEGEGVRALRGRGQDGARNSSHFLSLNEQNK
jgi:hypothetical protein